MGSIMKMNGGRLALALAGVLALGACGDDPTGLDDHSEPEGVVLRINGQTVASYDGDTRTWTGDLTVKAGQSTGTITVAFVDHDGHEIEADDDVYLEVTVANTSLAAFNHTAAGSFTGTLQGKAVGQTTAVFKLMHGSVGSGHSDFTTAPTMVRIIS